MILVYKAVNNINQKTYIGVTNNFSRRIVEHTKSDTPFGNDLKKDITNFTFSFEVFDSYESAYKRENQLVTEIEASSESHYNQRLGGEFGRLGKFASKKAHDNHPTHFSTDNNPMNDPNKKDLMIQKQNRKPVSVEGVEYSGVREAARMLDVSRQGLVYRLKSENYPNYFYI
ncbi:MAG: hypothetical protein GOVbin2917_76 [Prokaryotic dsDNA virus sp.]|jgi:predicted GIY-YIG superfamily endonuclease|nr:MAG: hypothetical protein GOVbin2917_76 [Prokaryotic dsDNA virus sp.]|tara:strand:+ start:50996 stop:51511 length:516 start_codon:yes stop_codon:yes gene_type:complete